MQTSALGEVTRLSIFETFRPSLARLREGLASRDAAEVVAAARATDSGVIERVLEHLDVTGEIDPRHRRWLPLAIDRRETSAARALSDRPASFVVRVLGPFVTPADTEVIRALAEAEAAEPGLAEALPPPLREAVERALESALGTASPEAARKLLGYLAARAETPSRREASLAILERAIASPSRRVRLHAHRLLRSLAPRDRYLRATRRLLDDSDAGTVRLAVRALAFGGDLESVGALAERLFHPHAAVSRAAREGLLAMGKEALPALERARARLRPDRRRHLDAVLGELRSRLQES